MTYFEDLTPYQYMEPENSKNVGWLDAKYSFPTGSIDQSCIEKITNLTKYAIRSARGGIFCAFCDEEDAISHEINGELYLLGTAEIRVFAKDGNAYAAPNLLLHYVTQHKYKPPDEFLKALAEGPMPPDEAYFERLREYELDWQEPPLYTPPRRIFE